MPAAAGRAGRGRAGRAAGTRNRPGAAGRWGRGPWAGWVRAGVVPAGGSRSRRRAVSGAAGVPAAAGRAGRAAGTRNRPGAAGSWGRAPWAGWVRAGVVPAGGSRSRRCAVSGAVVLRRLAGLAGLREPVTGLGLLGVGAGRRGRDGCGLGLCLLGEAVAAAVRCLGRLGCLRRLAGLREPVTGLRLLGVGAGSRRRQRGRRYGLRLLPGLCLLREPVPGRRRGLGRHGRVRGLRSRGPLRRRRRRRRLEGGRQRRQPGILCGRRGRPGLSGGGRRGSVLRLGRRDGRGALGNGVLGHGVGRLVRRGRFRRHVVVVRRGVRALRAVLGARRVVAVAVIAGVAVRLGAGLGVRLRLGDGGLLGGVGGGLGVGRSTGVDGLGLGLGLVGVRGSGLLRFLRRRTLRHLAPQRGGGEAHGGAALHITAAEGLRLGLGSRLRARRGCLRSGCLSLRCGGTFRRLRNLRLPLDRVGARHDRGRCLRRRRGLRRRRRLRRLRCLGGRSRLLPVRLVAAARGRSGHRHRRPGRLRRRRTALPLLPRVRARGVTRGVLRVPGRRGVVDGELTRQLGGLRVGLVGGKVPSPADLVPIAVHCASWCGRAPLCRSGWGRRPLTTDRPGSPPGDAAGIPAGSSAAFRTTLIVNKGAPAGPPTPRLLSRTSPDAPK